MESQKVKAVDGIPVLATGEQLFVEGLRLNSLAMSLLTLSLAGIDDRWTVIFTNGPSLVPGMLFHRHESTITMLRAIEWEPLDDSAESAGMWRRRYMRPELRLSEN